MDKSKLFSPFIVRGLTLPNRTIMAPMVTSLASPNSEVTTRLIAYHEARARGGFGLNILGATAVERAGYSYYCGLSIADDGKIKGLSRLTDAVHKVGGRMGIQLQHGGFRARTVQDDSPPMRLVSLIPGITPYEHSLVMDHRDIQTVVEAFSMAAIRAVQAGFDLVEIHGGHGYLLNQFLSPYYNHRKDEYGGPLENRIRFPLQVLHAVRKAVGPNFPVSFRISAEEFVDGALHLEDSCGIAQILAKNGVDIINVSIGIPASKQYNSPCPRLEAGWNAFRAEKIRKAIDACCAVAVVGRFEGFASAEEVLQKEQADLIVFGRASIAEPELPKKMLEGRFNDITPCMACNEGCQMQRYAHNNFCCAVNPVAARELLYPDVKAQSARNVVVIGAGPAGMTAAGTAARRGHTVTLLEQAPVVGGRLVAASMPPSKDVYAKLIKHLEHNLKQEGVDLRLNCKADLDTVCALKPDAVLVATGGLPIVPEFCASHSLLLAENVLLGKEDPGHNTAILGGGLVGAETAEFLAERGCDVTIIDMLPDLAKDLDLRLRVPLLDSLVQHKVKFIMESKVLSIAGPGCLRILSKSKTEQLLEGFDSIVLAFGYRRNTALADSLEQEGFKVTSLGDCVSPGKVMGAIHSAFAAAYSL